MRYLLIALALFMLTGCGDDTPPPPKPVQPNSHGVVLLFDEVTRKFSDINTCYFLDEVQRWVKTTYPLGAVSKEGWSSSGFYFVVVETETFQTTVYFNGTIVNIPMDC